MASRCNINVKKVPCVPWSLAEMHRWFAPFCSENVFYISQPVGGAIASQCEKGCISSWSCWECACKMSWIYQVAFLIWGILLKRKNPCKLKMSILNNEDGIWKGKYICIDHITVEIMCTDLCEIWIKSEGVTSNNVRGLSGSPGGAVKGRCENAGQSFCQCL